MIGLAVEISLRVVGAAAAVGFVLVVLRVRSGAARHAAWSAVLLTMLTMPGLLSIVPRVEVPVPSRLALDLDGVAGEATPPERIDPPATMDSPKSQLSIAVAEGQALAVNSESGRLVFDWRIALMALYVAGALFF